MFCEKLSWFRGFGLHVTGCLFRVAGCGFRVFSCRRVGGVKLLQLQYAAFWFVVCGLYCCSMPLQYAVFGDWRNKYKIIVNLPLSIIHFPLSIPPSGWKELYSFNCICLRTKYTLTHRPFGISMVNLLPFFNCVESLMLPPSFLIISLTIYRPRPEPLLCSEAR